MKTNRVAVPLLDHRIAPDDIATRLQARQDEAERRLDAVAALSDGARTFENTVEEIEQATADYVDTAQRLQILKDLHTDPAVRSAAAQAEEQAGRFLVKVGARRDLFRAVKAWADGPGRGAKLSPEQSRLLELMLRDFRRNGLELPDDKLARLVEIRTRLTELSTEFQRHLNENVDSVVMSDAELDGLPPAFVERLRPAPQGGRVVTTKYPDYVPFMENAKSGEARRRLFVIYNRREAQRNAPILKEAIALRDEAASLLGFDTHADFVTEDRMAKNGARVKEFLGSLADRLRTRRDADYAKLTALKAEETGDKNARLQPWDVSYFLNKLKKRDYSLDTEQIREFFPSEHVLNAMFGVYEDLLSIELRQVPDADVWAPEVRLYEIRDRRTGDLFAHFYADLYPREGKYGHAAVAPLTVPRLSPEGYREPVSVLLANFTPPSKDRPSLLTHEEVRTLFHEFGHVVHQSLTTARYSSQAGFNVAGDFVEAPSQMLENWVFEPAVLERMSAHWQDPGKKLPSDTIQRLREARLFNAGWHYTRQVYLASFDQALHTSGRDVDPLALEHALYERILGLEPVRETQFAASFGHLLGGYDAGYYGYLWSEVFAADMFTLFEQKGVLDEELGLRYRDAILAPGRSEEPDVLLEKFLGRPANNEAFLNKLGVQ